MSEVNFKYFDYHDVVFSENAVRKGIDNYPTPEVLENIIFTGNLMDRIREHLGFPIRVSSWLRVAKLNVIIGGSKTSSHVTGFAIDSTCPKLGTPLDYAKAVHKFLVENDIPFDQIIHEYGSWCHISFDRKNRGQLLTIFKNTKGKKYLPGLLTREQYLK